MTQVTSQPIFPPRERPLPALTLLFDGIPPLVARYGAKYKISEVPVTYILIILFVFLPVTLFIFWHFELFTGCGCGCLSVIFVLILIMAALQALFGFFFGGPQLPEAYRI